MYFRNEGLQKRSLDKYLKSRVSERPSTDNISNALKHFAILTTAPLPYLLIIVKVTPLEKVSFSYIQNWKTVC